MSDSSSFQKQYTEQELMALANQVTEALELGVSEHIWRTSLRIFEILRNENPIMSQYNPFLQDFRRFMTLITGHAFSGLLAGSKVHDILAASERFEEGESHPLLYEDVIGYGEQIRLGIFLEIHFHDLYNQGFTFAEIIRKLNTYPREVLLEKEIEIAQGFTPNQIPYYRLSSKGGAGAKTINPELLILA